MDMFTKYPMLYETKHAFLIFGKLLENDQTNKLISINKTNMGSNK